MESAVIHSNNWNNLFVDKNELKLVLKCYQQSVFAIKWPEMVDKPSSSSSCHVISTDISYPLSPPLPIVHCFWQVFRATSSICRELLYICSSWTSCLCSSLWKGPQEYIAYELIPTSPAVSHMSDSSKPNKTKELFPFLETVLEVLHRHWPQFTLCFK